MKRILSLGFIAIMAMTAISCEQPETSPDFKVSGVVLPDELSAKQGDEVTLRIFGQAPQQDDIVILVAEGGEETEMPISSLTEKDFSFLVPTTLYSDIYTMYLERGEDRIEVGKFEFNILVELEGTPAAASTVYGFVHCKGVPVKDVVLSDGVEVVKTNANGFYEIASKKANGYVFVSIPSGYTVKTRNCIPLIHQALDSDATVQERVDFNLVEDPDQEKFTMVVMGDIHLANRNNDIKQFDQFTADLNAYMAANPAKYYGLTMGDLAWDNYWKSFDLNDYTQKISDIKVPVFNTIGNHDHDNYAVGDAAAAIPYLKTVAPTYYSYNIGKVHFVALDNIKCNYDGKGDNDKYSKEISTDQINWLKKDLAMIDATTPVVVSMHAQFWGPTGANALSGSSNSNLLTALGSTREVHLMTGHTHLMYNVQKNNVYEHNVGSICATWWWTGSQTPGIHISQDGTPGGYLLFAYDDTKEAGKKFSWVFKSIGKDKSHQFRAYDRNNIELGNKFVYIPDANEESTKTYLNYGSVKAYQAKNTSNEVYINIWNWDTKWNLEVTEGGKQLTYTKVDGYDPLHTVSYPAKRLNANYSVTFATQQTGHMFKVKATKPDSALEIKVKDRFGNEYTQTLHRPSSFAIQNYL